MRLERVQSWQAVDRLSEVRPLGRTVGIRLGEDGRMSDRKRVRDRVLAGSCRGSLLLLSALIGLGCDATDASAPPIEGTWLGEDHLDREWRLELTGMEALEGTSLMLVAEGVWARMSVTGQYNYPALSLDLGPREESRPCGVSGEVARSGRSFAGTAICTFREGEETWDVEFRRVP